MSVIIPLNSPAPMQWGTGRGLLRLVPLVYCSALFCHYLIATSRDLRKTNSPTYLLANTVNMRIRRPICQLIVIEN